MRAKRSGFSLVEILIVLVVLGALAFVGYRVLGGKSDQNGQDNQSSQTTDNTPDSDVTWQFDGQKTWRPSGTPPTCPDPLFTHSPFEKLENATSPLLPGQWRGGHYKAHGGFRFDNAKNNKIKAYLPFDATLVGATRYTEIGQLQYLLTFEHPCGYRVRFDHLRALSPALQTIIETTPPATESTAAQPLAKTYDFKAGELLATEIGFTGNVGADLGVYDLRQANEISKNATWAAMHQNEAEQSFFGVCWFDLLPAKDAAHAKSIMPTQREAKYASDYCEVPAGQTLDHNGGQAPAES